ncbi:imidazole glycerol phosphate synthase subunit HisH [Verrucomicrobia bacterium]|nr:imidazole glycerol phosphate synthase subunit HisH [Verrucomicrobiota bacterium]
MSIGIVDVGIGNIGSLRGALYSQGWDTVEVSSPGQISALTHLLLPGVGAFSAAMKQLQATSLIKPIQDFAESGRPLLGICLGMQLLADTGTENGQTEGLSLLQGNVDKLNVPPGFRLPHVGWNELHQHQEHPLTKGMRDGIDFYFVHSYFFDVQEKTDLVGTTNYGIECPAMIGRNNVVGMQFHPEKSQRNGLLLLDKFCMWDGSC